MADSQSSDTNTTDIRAKWKLFSDLLELEPTLSPLLLAKDLRSSINDSLIDPKVLHHDYLRFELTRLDNAGVKDEDFICHMPSITLKKLTKYSEVYGLPLPKKILHPDENRSDVLLDGSEATSQKLDAVLKQLINEKRESLMERAKQVDPQIAAAIQYGDPRDVAEIAGAAIKGITDTVAAHHGSMTATIALGKAKTGRGRVVSELSEED